MSPLLFFTVRVVLLTGEGRAFCSGLALTDLAAGEITGAWFHRAELAFRAVETLDKPVIAGVQGHCLGGGLQLIITADVRIAADDAILGLPAAREAFLPGLGTYRLPRLIGTGWARHLILSGENIAAEEAGPAWADAASARAGLDARARRSRDASLHRRRQREVIGRVHRRRTARRALDDGHTRIRVDGRSVATRGLALSPHEYQVRRPPDQGVPDGQRLGDESGWRLQRHDRTQRLRPGQPHRSEPNEPIIPTGSCQFGGIGPGSAP